MTFRRSISVQYFEYEPAVNHRPDCPRYGTDLWEVRRDSEATVWKQEYTTTLRFVCRECGVVRIEQYTGPAGPIKTDTSTAEIGYGTKPERVRKDGTEVWLHAGPRGAFHDELGAETYYVTAENATPRLPSEALGIIGWHRPWRGSKLGAVKWTAGWRLTDDGSVKEPAENEFASKRAAALWVLEQHAAELADREAKRAAIKAERLAALTDAELAPAREVLAREGIDVIELQERRASACMKLKRALGIELTQALDLVDAIRERGAGESEVTA